MKYAQTLSILIASSLIVGCSWPIKRSTLGEPSALAKASCPTKLIPLNKGADMGDLELKIVEIAGIYYECIAAVGIK